MFFIWLLLLTLSIGPLPVFARESCDFGLCECKGPNCDTEEPATPQNFDWEELNRGTTPALPMSELRRQDFNKGQAAAKIGDWERALKHFRSALQLSQNPGERDSVQEWIDWVHGQKNPKPAPSLSDKRVRPQGLDYYLNEGKSLERQGRFKEAIDFYLEANRRGNIPTHEKQVGICRASTQWALRLDADGDVEQALSVLQKAENCEKASDHIKEIKLRRQKLEEHERIMAEHEQQTIDRLAQTPGGCTSLSSGSMRERCLRRVAEFNARLDMIEANSPIIQITKAKGTVEFYIADGEIQRTINPFAKEFRANKVVTRDNSSVTLPLSAFGDRRHELTIGPRTKLRFAINQATDELVLAVFEGIIRFHEGVKETLTEGIVGANEFIESGGRVGPRFRLRTKIGWSFGVIGTDFVVQQRAGEVAFKVFDGSVEVIPKVEGPVIQLRAGQSVQFKEDGGGVILNQAGPTQIQQEWDLSHMGETIP